MLRISATAAFVFLSSAALAQTYIEKPYNPAAGSRWEIVTESNEFDFRANGETRVQKARVRSELTIDEKTADGFRVTYTVREMDISGSTPKSAILQDAFGAMKDVVVRGRLNTAGKPVAVDNLVEVKATMTAAIERMVSRFDNSKPEAIAAFRQMMTGFFDVDGERAAAIYFEELSTLAETQNSGVKPGGVRRVRDDTPSPFGGVMLKAEMVTRLESFDTKAGKARFVRKREIDPESLKAATLALARQLVSATKDSTISPEVMEVMKKLNFSVESEARFDVLDGMTRMIAENTVTKTSAMGMSARKEQQKTVTVMPLK